ncbi:MAG: hypothetical protein F6J96_34880, partial [Symploca sp. SIO1C2]|nr:hypothetical protein [Symploca sp. SIO1C2]
MCRVLAYIGEPIQISQLLLKPDNSMVNQTFDPEDHYMIQLAGFGLATWSKGTLSEEYPLIYKGIKPPFYDRNLGSLCERHETNVLLCHVRGLSRIYVDKLYLYILPNSLVLVLARSDSGESRLGSLSATFSG